MGANEMALDVQSLEKLAKFNEEIQRLLKQVPELDKTFKMSNKLNGIFGEALGFTKLYEKFRDKADFEWKGGETKGFDILVTLKDTRQKIRFQIKTSSQEKYVFRVVKVTNLNAEKMLEQIKNKDFTEITERIKEAVKKAETDVWLLIHNTKNNQDFFWVPKEEMAEIVINHYKNAVKNRQHGKNFHAYIKNNEYRPHITQKEEWDRELLDRYKVISWSDLKIST
jgi:hypothetical protein